MTSPPKSRIDRGAPARLIRNNAALVELRERAREAPLYLVGGSVRDSLLGKEPLDLDIAVDGPVGPFAAGLDPDAVLHERFDTAAISIGDRRVDLARTRSEIYRKPGALPEVEPASIETDLSRRDFTINAIAVALDDPETLIDPLGGVEDLDRGVLRVIHPASFEDDPTRALRAARYAARLGFDIDHRSADLLAAVDLTTVSPQRIRAELELISREPEAPEALRLASAWRLIQISDEELGLVTAAFDLLATESWAAFCSRADVVEAVLDQRYAGRMEDLNEYPGSPSRATSLAGRKDPTELILARAGGAEWLDSWVSEWRSVGLRISGDDLIAAGVPAGEAVGIGLEAAQRAALDEDLLDRDAQLSVALEAAGLEGHGSSGVGG